jgi:NAD(P)H dehydrogenase (quinone)
MMPKAFIPAITGAQSTAIAEALRKAGWRVEGSSRSVDANLEAKASDADALILTIPQDHRPGAMTQFVNDWVKLARSGGVKRIVLNVGGTPGPAEASPFFADLHTAKDSVMASGLPYVVLQPTIYLDNLAAPWAAQGLAAGTLAYPAAADVQVSWMSHQTLGKWVVAVVDGAADGRILPIGGPQTLSGEDLAREVGAAIGRQLTYVPIPLAAFSEGMNAAMGAPAGDRLASIYAWLADHPTSMRVDVAEAERFGVELENARTFAARVLA